jgi:tRNA 2-selenouridine synthase
MLDKKPVHVALSLAFGLEMDHDVVVFDARSPAEYADGHIPGSINLPLLDNDQRALVGTCYKSKGRQQAIDLGFQLASPFFLDKIIQARQSTPCTKTLVYCARGGLRSEIITWLLVKGGFDAQQLQGGYKQWRQFCLEQFALPRSWFVISGMTGVGKTEILTALKDSNESVIDLEGLAQHKGSAFGGIGQPDQMRQEQFENYLAIELASIKENKRCWLEDESRFIGKLRIPDELYRAKVSGKRVVIERSFGDRLKRVLEEYGILPKEDLTNKTQQLTKRLGFDQVKLATEHLANNEMEQWATIMLAYYDKQYLYGFDLHKETCIGHVHADGLKLKQIIHLTIEKAIQHEQGCQ